jgi:hypothetical protein
MNNMPFSIRPIARVQSLLAPRAWLAALSIPMLLTLSTSSAWAQSQPAAPSASEDNGVETIKAERVGKGDATRGWLNAQASRRQASSTRQTLSGPVMSTVHDRYVQSFAHPVVPTSIRADMPPTSR